MVHTRSSVAGVSINPNLPSYSTIDPPSSRKMSLRPVRPSIRDSSINYTEDFISESSPSTSLSSESMMSLDMTTSPTPKPSFSPELASSPGPSGTPETPSTSVSATDQLSAIRIKQSHVETAEAAEAAARVELSKTRTKETDHRQSAKSKRQRMKDLEIHIKKIRAKINGLKAAAQDHEKNAKRLNSLLPDLEEGVDEARVERMKFQSELADLQYDKMLSERYPDLVIRKLVKRMDKDEQLAETFHNFQQGELRLDKVEALETQLDGICKEIFNEKADRHGSESGDLEQGIEGTVEGDGGADRDVEMASDGAVEGGNGVERQREYKRGEEGNEDEVLNAVGGMLESAAPKIEDRLANPLAELCQENQTLRTNACVEVLGEEDTCRNDGAGRSVKAEPELDARMDIKDKALKPEAGVKDKEDEEEDGLGNLTEPHLRKRLQNAKAVLQGWQAQARLLTSGKRKRDYEDDDDKEA